MKSRIGGDSDVAFMTPFERLNRTVNLLYVVHPFDQNSNLSQF